MIVHKIDRAESVKEEGRYMRRIIRRNKAGLTRSEAEALVCLVNLWLHHRNGPNGYIHPGRKLIAKRAKCSVPTVARALKLFRELELISPIKHLKGGQRTATQYTVNFTAIRELFDPSNVVTIAGELVPFTVSREAENDTVKADQNDTLSICSTDLTFPDQESRFSDWEGCSDE